MVWTTIDLALLKFTIFYNWKMDDRIIYVNWGEEIFMYIIYFPLSCKHTLLHLISPPHPPSSQTPVIFQGLSSGHDTRQLCDFNKKMLPGFTKRQRISNTDWNAPLWSHFAVIFTTGKKKKPTLCIQWMQLASPSPSSLMSQVMGCASLDIRG